MNEKVFRTLKKIRKEKHIGIQELQKKVTGEWSLTFMRCPCCGKLGGYQVGIRWRIDAISARTARNFSESE